MLAAKAFSELIGVPWWRLLLVLEKSILYVDMSVRDAAVHYHAVSLEFRPYGAGSAMKSLWVPHRNVAFLQDGDLDGTAKTHLCDLVLISAQRRLLRRFGVDPLG